MELQGYAHVQVVLAKYDGRFIFLSLCVGGGRGGGADVQIVLAKYDGMFPFLSGVRERGWG